MKHLVPAAARAHCAAQDDNVTLTRDHRPDRPAPAGQAGKGTDCRTDERPGMIPLVWLASYPRSGNTMLRIILAQCFGLPSAAIYPEDFGGNRALQELTGRIAPTSDGVIEFGDVPVRVAKTHGRPQDGSKAIYVVRNGVDATASFHDHGRRQIPIETLIRGRPGLPKWSDHIAWWAPRTRPNTLLLRYEDVVADIGRTVDLIADFIHVAPLTRSIPSRDELAAVDGKWVRSATAAGRTKLSSDQIAQFWELNGDVMVEYGYSRQPGDSPVSTPWWTERHHTTAPPRR